MFMKSTIAPPDGASLTAVQLAAIGQYAVNVVDFRDPDDTMTKFLNYDLTLNLTPAVTCKPPRPTRHGPAAGHHPVREAR